MLHIKHCLAILFASVIILPFLSGCTKQYSLKKVIKSDIDLVIDKHIEQNEVLLKSLTSKLYKRNPRELKKNPNTTIKYRLKQLFKEKNSFAFKELYNKKGNEALDLAFNPNFEGDRVFAFMTGLTSMIRSSYNNQQEFFMLDSLDEQKLYNSARNVEIIIWRLNNITDDNSNPLIYANSLASETTNRSFERLLGKIIVLQDMMAEITADKTQRTINKVVISVAKATLLPVGI